MFNHARNLLLNIAPPSVQTCAYAGDELIDPAFRPVVMTPALTSVRTVLFGANPDRVMLNYRARQILNLLHAGPLVEFITDLDPRITYGFDDEPFLAGSLYAPAIEPLTAVAPDRLRIAGDPQAPDITGRMQHDYAVDVLTTETVQLRRMLPSPYAVNISEFALAASGWSERIKLGMSGYDFSINTTSPGASWRIAFLVRPQYDLGAIAATLTEVGEPTLVELFGTAKEEPYLTFRNLWFDAKDTTLKLGGLLLAWIYRANLRRVRGA